MQNKDKVRPSLYVTLGIIIISTVIVAMSIDSTYTYINAKEKIVNEMQQNTRESVVALQKNIAGMIASFAIAEYDKFIQHEMEVKDIYAIIVNDYKMGKIFGTDSYISGRIRNKEWEIIEFDPENKAQIKRLNECAYSETHPVNDIDGTQIGHIQICNSDKLIVEQLNQIIFNTIYNTIVISLLLTITLFTIIRIFILNQVSNIIEILEHKDKDGIPTDLVPEHGANEIFTLSHVMNKMIE